MELNITDDWLISLTGDDLPFEPTPNATLKELGYGWGLGTTSTWRLYYGADQVGKVITHTGGRIVWCLMSEPLAAKCHGPYDDIETAKADCVQAALKENSS